MTRVLVTGATGLVGTRLLHELAADVHVCAIARSGRVDAAASIIPIDLAQPWSTDSLPRDIDTVIHLAQSEHFRAFPHRVEDVFAVNTQSTVKLLDYARNIGARQFILASTGGVYGGGAGRLAEEAPFAAVGEAGFYVGTRVCSELLSDCYTSYMNVICLRFFFVYGPGQQSHMLIPRLVESVRTGKAVTLRGADGVRLNPIHVDDAALAVRKAMTVAGSHKINVAGPAALSLREVAETIGRAVGRFPEFDVQPGETSRDLVADTARMGRLLCEPRIRFDEGIASMIASIGV